MHDSFARCIINRLADMAGRACAQQSAPIRFSKQKVKQSPSNDPKHSMKKSSSLLLILTLALALLTWSNDAFAGKPAAPKRTPIPPKHTTISSVSADSITISTGDSSKTYQITPSTVIEYQGQTVKTTDLQPGMRVSVSAGMDPAKADRISASEAPKGAPAPNK
jgi:hypothetical protein